MKAPPAGMAMKSMASTLTKAAPAAASALRPGGAMQGVFQKALGSIGKVASADPGLSLALFKLAQFYGPIVPFTDQADRGAAPIPRTRLDKITSREQIENAPAKREDGRDFISFENAPGTSLNEVAATNQPQERTASAKHAHSSRAYLKAFGHGVGEELPTAAGAALGLGAAKIYEMRTGKKINPIAASGLGYGVGSLADMAFRGH